MTVSHHHSRSRQSQGPTLDLAPPGGRASDLPLLASLAADAAQVLRPEALARLRPFGVTFDPRAVAWVTTSSLAHERAPWPAFGSEGAALAQLLHAVTGALDRLADNARHAPLSERLVAESAKFVAAARTRPDHSGGDRDLLMTVWSAASWNDLTASA